MELREIFYIEYLLALFFALVQKSKDTPRIITINKNEPENEKNHRWRWKKMMRTKMRKKNVKLKIK